MNKIMIMCQYLSILSIYELMDNIFGSGRFWHLFVLLHWLRIQMSIISITISACVTAGHCHIRDEATLHCAQIQVKSSSVHSAKPELQGDDANSAINNLQSLERERMGQHDKETHTALHYSVSAGTVISVIPILSPEYEVQSTNSAPRRCPQSIIWALALRHLVWKLKFKRWRLLLLCCTNVEHKNCAIYRRFFRSKCAT